MEIALNANTSFHCLTPEKGVLSFRYFLPQMRTPHLSRQPVLFESFMTECGVRIWGRKYLNECMSFSGVRQCSSPLPVLQHMSGIWTNE